MDVYTVSFYDEWSSAVMRVFSSLTAAIDYVLMTIYYDPDATFIEERKGYKSWYYFTEKGTYLIEKVPFSER